METKILVTVKTNHKFKVLPMDENMELVAKDSTEKEIKIANEDYAKELHADVVDSVLRRIENLVEDDNVELVEEAFVEGHEDYSKDYGIEIKAEKKKE